MNNVKCSKSLEKKLGDTIVKYLKEISQEYKLSVGDMPKLLVPKIQLFPYEQGVFKGVHKKPKNKYIN
jgi:hypothetical protein